MNGQKTATAIFDLDGTITKRGTYSPFLLSCGVSPWRKYPGAFAIVLAMAGYKLRLISRKSLKEFMLARIIAGIPRKQIDLWAEAFVDKIMENGLNPGAVEALNFHREQGHRIIIATACMDIVALKIARRFNITEVICSRSSWDRDDNLVARIEGGNCFGRNKLDAVIASGAKPGSPPTYAYSDHQADLELLIWADEGIAVNPTKKLRSAAQRHGLKIKNWGNHSPALENQQRTRDRNRVETIV